MGDEIQFCRYLTRVKTEKHAVNVIMLGSKSLKSLMVTLPHLDNYLTREEVQHTLPPADY